MTTYQITFNERTNFGKNFLLFLEENKKYVKINNNTKINSAKMTKEEFDAGIQLAREQYERGEYTVYNSEEFRKKYGLD